MRRRLKLVILLPLLALGVLLLPHTRVQGAPTQASTALPPTLDGETLVNTATHNVNSVTCSALGSGSWTFSSTGTATGPYSGTFTETGAGTVSNSALTAWSAQFTIQSPLGAVTGTMSLLTAHSATCIPGNSGDTNPFTTTYQVTIHTPTGDFIDQGTATTVEDATVSGGGDFLQEFFHSSQTQTMPVPTATPTATPSPAPVLISNPATALTIGVQGCGSLNPPAGTVVAFAQAAPVTAVPCPGSVFTGWLGGPCNGTTINPCDIAAIGTTAITATFTP